MKEMTWQQGTAVGLATVLGFGVAQEEASGLILEVTSQATEPQPAKPTYMAWCLMGTPTKNQSRRAKPS
jgi:hypothetical protein